VNHDAVESSDLYFLAVEFGSIGQNGTELEVFQEGAYTDHRQQRQVNRSTQEVKPRFRYSFSLL